MALLLILLAWVSADPARPDVVPDNAECQVISSTVRIYHWTSPHSETNKLKVMIFPVVDDWPMGKWGAEVTVTPIPFCCGASRTYFRWTKSDRIEPRWAGTIRVGSSHQLAFRFK